MMRRDWCRALRPILDPDAPQTSTPHHASSDHRRCDGCGQSLFACAASRPLRLAIPALKAPARDAAARDTHRDQSRRPRDDAVWIRALARWQADRIRCDEQMACRACGCGACGDDRAAAARHRGRPRCPSGRRTAGRSASSPAVRSSDWTWAAAHALTLAPVAGGNGGQLECGRRHPFFRAMRKPLLRIAATGGAVTEVTP